MRSLLTVVTLLGVLICGLGTAHAVYGVADDVRAKEIVIPFVCARDYVDTGAGANQLNTLYAIAETLGNPPLSQLHDPWVRTDRVYYNSDSASILDYPTTYTARDILSFDCKTDFMAQPVGTKDFYTVTVNGVKYIAGYMIQKYITSTDDTVTTATCTVAPCFQDRFVSWAYLLDAQKGFASGFNGLAMENGETRLAENAGNAAITALSFYPRLYVHNSPTTYPDTWNWLIFLAGRPQLSCAGITPAGGRVLTGYICGPAENCLSVTIPLPKELNIIDVMTGVSNVNAAMPGFAKSGFITGDIVETYTRASILRTLVGTINPASGGYCGTIAASYYSMFGWSYQRAQDAAAAPFLSWSAIHPMHRVPCTGQVPNGVVGTCTTSD